MQRPDQPLTERDYDEFGNPGNPKVLRNLLSFSPCSNIKDQSYPAMFLKTGDEDYQVGPWEALKYVTRVREMQRTRAQKTLKGIDIDCVIDTVVSSERMVVSDIIHEEHPEEKLIVFKLSKNCGHDGPSDLSQSLYLQAMEVVFLETAVKK